MKRASTADEYFANITQWQEELAQLRRILRSSGLDETMKWGSPCYTAAGKNVVGLAGFKSYFGLWFFQGALLRDKEGVLSNAQEGSTRAMRQWRMLSAGDIKPALIKRYVEEAADDAKHGRAIRADRNKAVVVPPQLEAALEQDSDAGAAFRKLRPGLQREFTEYVREAKRDATKLRRIDKILPMISAGKGLNDKYR